MFDQVTLAAEPLQVYLFMGIIIGSAVFPIYCCLTWKKTSALAAIAGALAEC